MKRCRFSYSSLVLVFLTCLLVGVDPLFAAETIVDLTHPFDQQTIYWPTEPGFVVEKGPAGFTERGYWYAANRFAAPEHGGTHVDAPIHFYKEGQTVDQIPLWRLVGEGVCIDVSTQCAADRDYLVTVEDLRRWEQSQQASLREKIILIRTGFASRWPNRAEYLGTTATGRVAVSQLHFPGLDPAAAEWLAVERRVKCVGIDTASIDHGPSRDFGSHVALFRHGVPALENLASLDKLPPNGFRIAALPMKIASGTGAPCRVVALIDEN
jgi:kynurenine formamidase